MPVYEYRCTACGSDFSYLKLKAADEPACPKCESKKVEKKISSFSCSGGSGSGGGLGHSGSC